MARSLFSRRLSRFAKERPAVQRAVWQAEALPLLALWRMCAALTPDRASDLGAALLARVGPRLRRSRRIEENLTRALPDLEPAERDRLVEGVWRSMGRVLAEYPHLEAIATEPGRIERVVPERAAAAVADHKQIVIVTGHFGNWEVAPLAARGLVDAAVLYSPQSNGAVEAALQAYRAPLRLRFLAKDGGLRALSRVMRDGGSVGVLMDQRVDEGETVPLFGQPVPTLTAPLILAARFRVPLLPVRVERLEGVRFRVTAYDPLVPEAGDPRREGRVLATRINALFETWIRQRPDQWLCTTRRWPKDAIAPATAAAADVAAVEAPQP